MEPSSSQCRMDPPQEVPGAHDSLLGGRALDYLSDIWAQGTLTDHISGPSTEDDRGGSLRGLGATTNLEITMYQGYLPSS